ncbi:MAG: hypothetical protein ACFB50_00890 [Rubrobacteraceae bacterium]
MITPEAFDAIPLLVVYLITVIIGFLAIEAGFRMGKAWQRRFPEEQEEGVGAMVGAALAGVAFLLAFLIGIAVDRYDTRRGFVLEEANAIGTTYLRTDFLGQPYDRESKELLREYVDTRLLAIEPGQLSEAIARSEEIQQELWTRSDAVATANPNSEIVALYVDSLNETIDANTKRVVAGVVARIPVSLWLGLYVVIILALMLVGLQSSYGERRNLIALTLLVLVFSAVVYLAIDLDRSQQGLLRVSQQPLVDLQEQLSTPEAKIGQRATLGVTR